ncbi:MinD-like ATPase involved in chromosome partitioning or flagellar assembly [Micromonospora carbonacea]|uniref:MinD-like ATPase involved in chromosome partitioning or flagellar assembly n=2 Tax=Micromonospora carbonacea TaxID=47853 RepID=A0A1C4Z4Z5_9ACTN|nr:chromosome partitioning protein [Micromonospora carbonacea]SCF28048.1 MinD-like ATPase involved in chromosome partitioning or flagellar assembly [Micromonospora carbonacea]
MDDNADRVHVPGQQPVPERDIEPLWPPEATDPGRAGSAPAWATTTAAGPVPYREEAEPSFVASDAYPSLGATPGAYAPPHQGVGSPGEGLAATGPEQGGPGPDAWAAPGTDGRDAWTAHGMDRPDTWAAPGTDGPDAWAAPGTGGHAPVPAETAWAPPAVGGVPAPRAGQPTPGPVDLHLPFTLDPQAAPGPLPGDLAGSPGDAALSEQSTAAAGPPATDGTTAAGPVPVAPGVTAVGPMAAPGAPAAGATATNSNGAAGGAEGPGGGRVAESPWALPPQRPAPSRATGAEARPAPPMPTETAARPAPPGPADGVPRPVEAVPPQPADGMPRPVEAAPPQPPGPFPPVMNPPGPLAPSPYPPAVAGPVEPYAEGYPATTGEASAGWGPGPQQPPPGPVRPDAAPPGPRQPGQGHPDQAHPVAGQPGIGQPATTGWYPPGWPPQPTPQQPTTARQPVAPVPQPPYREADGVTRVPPGYPEPAWTPDTGVAPTAEDFARRRQVRPADPVATMGVRAVVNKTGLIKLAPGRHEQEMRRDIEMVRRNFGGLRQVTVVNPKGGAGKTVAILLLAMTFGQKRGGYVLAWDNNETQGTLGMRAQQDFHSRTVRDMLRDLGQFQGAHGRVGDLSQYVRSQGEGMFDVLASDESATGGEMLTASAFAEIREVVSRFYKLIFVDTGNNVRAQNWQAAMDATDQLVVTMSARNDSAETAARMLDHLEQSGRHRLVRQAVTVVSMPPSRKEIDLPAIQEHFAARTRAVLLAPYERLIDTGEPIRYGQLSSATRDAWLKIAASVAEGL